MTVEKHDLELNFFIDLVQISQNRFTPFVQLCSPSKILHRAALFSQNDGNQVTIKDYFETDFSARCEQKRLT